MKEQSQKGAMPSSLIVLEAAMSACITQRKEDASACSDNVRSHLCLLVTRRTLPPAQAIQISCLDRMY